MIGLGQDDWWGGVFLSVRNYCQVLVNLGLCMFAL